MAALTGCCAIVTGASVGLGYAIAHALVVQGASVCLCARGAAGLERAHRSLLPAVCGSQRIVSRVCDVSSERQVKMLADHALAEFGRIEILINNAGIQGPIGPTEQVSLPGWRRTFEVNLYGTLYACRALIPDMRSHGYGKIVNLSGGGAASPRPFLSAYAAAKAAVVRLTENFAEELKGTGIDINAVAPGALNTQMLDQALAAGPALLGETQYRAAARQKQEGGSSFECAAELVTYLASAESDGISGRLISANWDGWRTLHEHREELHGSDVYTLRRIVPEDRVRLRAPAPQMPQAGTGTGTGAAR